MAERRLVAGATSLFVETLFKRSLFETPEVDTVAYSETTWFDPTAVSEGVRALQAPDAERRGAGE